MTTYRCPTHGTEQDSFCAQCVDDLAHAPDPATMTGEERANEMRRWEVLTVPFGDLHARIEALVGRPVWTHEMGPGWESLIEESRTRPGIVDMQRIIDSLAETMPTTVVVVDE